MERPYGWVIVAAGSLLGCVAIGALFSLAVFLQPMSEATGWSRTGISTTMTIDFLVMGVAAFGWGALTDRFGPRIVVVSGTILLGLGIVLASRATSLLQFQLIYGIVVGVAAGAVFAPMIATVTGWFDKRRSLAVSLVSAGMGVAPMTVAPFAQWLIQSYDWRTSFLVIGIASWVLLIPAALLVRRAPTAEEGAPGAPAEGGEGLTVGRALRSPQFIVLSLTFFFCCAAHSGPIFHVVSYALACGLPAMTAVTIYSAEGMAGLAGRLLFGVLGDRYGARRIVVIGLMVQAIGAGAYYFARSAGEFYAVAILFGMAYGGVMPLYAVIAREYFPMRIMGTVFGGAAMISSLGMALGPAAGGWLFDNFGGYGLLYVGSFAVGLAAVAMALAFPARPASAVLRPA
ncbi:MAG: MFS transporter [Reyranella sp.]|nr:MAG: MFS transporter [Reyranella sp.]